MKVIRPAVIDSTNLTSNIAEAAPATYNPGITYALGDRAGVVTGTTIRIYQSLAGSNTGNSPTLSPTWWAFVTETYPEYSNVTTYAAGDVVINATTGTPTHHVYESVVSGNAGNLLSDPSKWLDRGPTNRLAMFDTVNGTATVSGANIDVTAALIGRADGMALFGMSAEKVQVTVATVDDGTVYDREISLISDSGISDWYEYFTEEIVYKADLVLTDLPPYNNPSVRVQITSASGEVAVGTAIIGQTRRLGTSLQGLRAGIHDYSKKETDEFGRLVLVQRPYSKTTTVKVLVENYDIDAVYNLLAGLRTAPTVWAATDDFAMTWSFAYWKDFVAEMAYPAETEFSLELESLT